MLELLGNLIKVLVLFSFVIAFINPLVFIVFLFRFIGRARLLKGLINQVDDQGEITNTCYKASSLYFRSELDASYTVYPIIENLHGEVKGCRSFLLISFIIEVVAIFLLNQTVFK